MNNTERIENEILEGMAYLVYLEEQEETMRSIEILEDGNDFANDYEARWQKQSSHLRGMLKIYAIIQGVKTSEMRTQMWGKYNAIKEESK